MAEEIIEYIELGRVSGVYGVQGWVRVFSYTEPRDNILAYSPLYLEVEGHWRPFEIQAGRRQGKGLVARFVGCENRDDAAALMNRRIAVRREQLPPAGEGEYYWTDLLGLRVVTTRGEELGTVSDLMETGANDVLVVQGDRERLIPFTWGVAVQSVDLESGVLTVDWEPEF